MTTPEPAEVRGDYSLDEAVALIKRMHDRLPHRGCNACAVCMAHNFLYGHWPSERCCWPPHLRNPQTATSGSSS